MSPEQHQAQRPQAPAAPNIQVDPWFVNFLCYSVDPAFRRLPEAECRKAAEEFAAALDRPH